jgi:xylulokinase
MSLLGIDVGTTACKVVAFSAQGELIASASDEYDILRRQPGWAELDVPVVWGKVKRAICAVTAKCTADPVQALAVSSLGEAVVPVTDDREILDVSILNFDARGEEYLPRLREVWDDPRLYQINGNTLGNSYTLSKLMWLREHQPDLYAHADKFLLWGSFVGFMLGADPAVDYSLANRTLMFDLERRTWSHEILELGEIAEAKLAAPVPAGIVIGRVSYGAASELGLRPGTLIVAGAHDQCANAVGAGVMEARRAAYGMGTFICITTVFRERRAPEVMIPRGLSTEHHAAPDRYACFIYNRGGACVKWFRDTFAAVEREQVADVYARLFAEMPPGPSHVLVLTDFAASGAIGGLNFETTRGDILKAIVEGTTFDLREKVEALPPTDITIDDFCAVGGGSKSDAWVQTCADILGRPFLRPTITEAGALGAAIIAGVGAGIFPSFQAGVQAMVRPDRTFEPDARRQKLYQERFAEYKELKRRMQA